MAINITDGTKYVEIEFDTNRRESIQKGSVILVRDEDEIRFVTSSNRNNNLYTFKAADVTLPAHVEVLAEGTVTLNSGGAGSVDGITVGGVEIMSAAENYDTSLIQTATNVAANITAFTSNPNYTAASGGTTTITITAVAGSGNTPNGLATVSDTITIVTTDVDMGTTTLGESEEDVLEATLQTYLFVTSS